MASEPETVIAVMIGVNRGQLLTTLREFSERYPQWRFGQMVTNIACWIANEMWYAVDDQRIVQTVREHLDRRFVNSSGRCLLEPHGTRQALLDALDELLALDATTGIVRVVNQLALIAQVNVYDIEDDQLLDAARTELGRRRMGKESTE